MEIWVKRRPKASAYLLPHDYRQVDVYDNPSFCCDKDGQCRYLDFSRVKHYDWYAEKYYDTVTATCELFGSLQFTGSKEFSIRDRCQNKYLAFKCDECKNAPTR